MQQAAWRKARPQPANEIVGEATSGEDALARLANLSPDLVFLDIQMPGMTGFDLLERLDDVPPVIFTTRIVLG